MGTVNAGPSGGLVERDGEMWYEIARAERMRPFLMSIVSDDDHWLFVASNGGLTAGRRNSDRALFPYCTEDMVLDGAASTGPLTLARVEREGGAALWEPFAAHTADVYRISRRVAKPILGNAVRFEETNHDLGLRMAYAWRTSSRYGFVREAELVNAGDSPVRLRLLDGLRNILPANVQAATQQGMSCLLDAYKQAELDGPTGLACYTLASQLCDLPEPRESLYATVAWQHGLQPRAILLSTDDLPRFRAGEEVSGESYLRARRGAYLVATTLALEPGERAAWTVVADVRRSQGQVAELRRALRSDKASVLAEVHEDVASGTSRLLRIVADTDGLQSTGDGPASAHHLANVMFNDMRGGVFADGYGVPAADFRAMVGAWNRPVAERHREFLEGLEATVPKDELLRRTRALGDPDIERLTYEYLPLWFSRRHGDPSRPWNRFEIDVRDDAGREALSFEGNWRDIFQNWEALALGYPAFLPHMIVKFVNASTMDGYNPYRITKRGVDWEVPNPDDPWAGIGYWGDHQIVYLCRLMEWADAFDPDALRELLLRDIFTYAEVPYRIKPYEDIRRAPHHTIDFDRDLHRRVLERAGRMGSDGRLVQGPDGMPLRVNMVEKLLVAVLAKVSNLVPGSGIWMNTQRPEWNDANNALVGYGVSVVTLCHLRRFVAFLLRLLEPLGPSDVPVSSALAEWLSEVAEAVGELAAEGAGLDDAGRGRFVDVLGRAASTYRSRVYRDGPGQRRGIEVRRALAFLDALEPILNDTIEANRRADGMYHAYNLMVPGENEGMAIGRLDAMLEGQVAALSSGVLSADEAARLLGSLPASALYRADQHSYILYPDKRLPSFLEKNRIPEELVETSALMEGMLADGDARLVARDTDGRVRFHPDLTNADHLASRLDDITASGRLAVDADERRKVLDVYEAVFGHRAFTGRSSGMFAYEGLGSIYWHMVGKLLLAIQETVFAARDEDAGGRLREAYFDVRQGLGFNKSPVEFGAFPFDPYSHTPAHSGARQPGMTGQVKEEIITRLGELGVRIEAGELRIRPILLRASEFHEGPRTWVLPRPDGGELSIDLPAGSLGFTYCGVVFVYHKAECERIEVSRAGGGTETLDSLALGRALSAEIFARSGVVERVDAWLRPGCPG